MDIIITELVNQFERGGLTRRQLIQSLAALVAAGAIPESLLELVRQILEALGAACGIYPPLAVQSLGLKATGIDHTSVLVSDLQRSAAFYQRVFGLMPVSEDKANRILRLGAGGTGVDSTIVSLRQQNPRGLIDHFAISVEQFDRDAVTQVLKQHDLTPDQNMQIV